MSSQKITLTPPRKSGWQLPALVLLLGLVWLLVWPQLQALADWFTYDLIGLLPETRLGESVNFFFYDVPKILVLLAGMIFLVTWRRERLRTASGFTIDSLGLDTGARGAKVDEQRPDLIIIDDVDELFDTFKTTQQKIQTLTQTLLPAGSIDCGVLFIQNLIHVDSIASRLVDGRADFLTDRIVSGPHPAVKNLVCEQVDGKFIIKSGTATWEGQSLDTCQSQILQWGYSAFMNESQHDLEKTGGLWDHIEFRHEIFQNLPEFIRTAVWVDPAISETDESDSMGISAAGMSS